MSSSTSESSKKKVEKKPKSKEDVLVGFQRLRMEQRLLTQKVGELEMEMQEHKLVIGTLKKMVNERKCFRMVGGVLLERTVGEVLPIIVMQEEHLQQLVANLNCQLVAKGTEINSYKEQHNIKVRGVDDTTDVQGTENKASSSGVLVL